MPAQLGPTQHLEPTESCLTFRGSSPGTRLPPGPGSATLSTLGQPRRGAVLSPLQPLSVGVPCTQPSWQSTLKASVAWQWGGARTPVEAPWPSEKEDDLLSSGVLLVSSRDTPWHSGLQRMMRGVAWRKEPLPGLLFSHWYIPVTSFRPTCSSGQPGHLLPK